MKNTEKYYDDDNYSIRRGRNLIKSVDHKDNDFSAPRECWGPWVITSSANLSDCPYLSDTITHAFFQFSTITMLGEGVYI